MLKQFSCALVLVLAFLGATSPAQRSPVQQPPGTEGNALPLAPTRDVEFDVGEGTWMSLDVSPNGKTFVFELLGDLYVLSSQGGTAGLIAGGLPFDSQPTFSPDSSMIAFISDRSGNENVWISKPDGNGAKQLSQRDDNTVFISPAWSADGHSVFVSTFKPDLNAFEILRYDLSGSSEQITHAKSTADQPKEYRSNALGAVASRDGRYLYYAAKTGEGFKDEPDFPLWHVARRNLATGEEETVVTAQGSAMRPVLSPDGRSLVYGTRFDGETGLRLRDLATGDDRWLVYPVQHDDQEGSASRDLLPRYAFMPDGKSLVMNYGGKIRRIDVATGKVQVIPFTAHVALAVGPQLRLKLKEETGPVRARLIQWPSQSPDGERLTFATLGHVYIMTFRDGRIRRLSSSDEPEFQPSWSPDGRSIVYVTWTARGGHIWSASVDGEAQPTRLTDTAAYYTNPVFTPDAQGVIALRSSNYERMHKHLESGQFRQADAIRLPASGGSATVIVSGKMGGAPQFTHEAGRVYLFFQDGLNTIKIDGSDRRRIVQVNGPGFYFQEGSVPVDDLRISPDGNWVLAQIVQQLYLVAVPSAGGGATVELSDPTPGPTKLTSAGADFFAWADGGRTITWALGSTFYRRSLATVLSDQAASPTVKAAPNKSAVDEVPVVVEVERDIPHGAVVLRGATAITMKGDEVINDADIVIMDNRIAAIGKRGQVAVPTGAAVRDVSGKFILPGFIDVHQHWAELRRGILDLHDWGFLADLASGVTSDLDPSPLSIDIFAYKDLVDSGAMIGPRLYSTGPALFSYNNFSSEQEVEDVLHRYRDDYGTRNLKQYRTGNRRVREWVAEAAHKLGLMPTCEGALDMKLDLTQVQDGFAGDEHSFTAVPLFSDVVQFVARARTSYTPTLEISNGGPPAENHFFISQPVWDSRKIARFVPRYVIDEKTERLKWFRADQYLYPQMAVGVAKIMRAGGLIGVGSHGEFEGSAYQWELQALAAGGLTPQEVLRAATIESSEVIGRDLELGSLEPGKFADLIVLDENPLLDIRNTSSIRQVMQNGRLYEADTMDEIWPRQRPLEPLWFWEDNPADR